MKTELVIAGFGGQGVLLLGQILAYAGLHEEKHVTWAPSYGAEMRGGTATCSIIVSDHEINNPYVTHPDILVAMNQPSVLKFEKLFSPGELLIFNSSLAKPTDSSLFKDVMGIPVTDLAVTIDQRVANIVMIGFILKMRPFLENSSIEYVISNMLFKGNKDLVDMNIKAFTLGIQH